MCTLQDLGSRPALVLALSAVLCELAKPYCDRQKS